MTNNLHSKLSSKNLKNLNQFCCSECARKRILCEESSFINILLATNIIFEATPRRAPKADEYRLYKCVCYSSIDSTSLCADFIFLAEKPILSHSLFDFLKI